MKLSERLKHLRKSKGVTQKEVAEKIGVTPSAYGMYEQGIRKPKDEQVWKAMADYFGISIKDLMGFSRESENEIYDFDDLLSEIERLKEENQQLKKKLDMIFEIVSR